MTSYWGISHCLHTFGGLGPALEVGRGEREPKGTGSQLKAQTRNSGAATPAYGNCLVPLNWEESMRVDPQK